MQDDKKEKPKDEKKKKNKYIVKDGDGNIMDVEVPESWIKILEALKFQCLYRSFYFHWLKQSG